MFERQFGLRENPFVAGHQSRFVYPSREHQEALAHLRYGIENREPFVLITGEVGTGKTTALYDVLAEWQNRVVVALITNSALTRDELLEEICVRFGVTVSPGATKPQLLVHLERHLLAIRARGDRAILILDEAQNLGRDLLEEIRLLSNLEVQGDKLMQVFLVGQPELEDLLAQPELRQLRQRIAVLYQLHPLSEDDTERYIHHRLSVAGGHAISMFPPESCREVFALTHGIPREINTVAAQAMLNAFVEDSAVVLAQHVRAIAKDTEFQSVMRGAGRAASDAANNNLAARNATPVSPPMETPRPQPVRTPAESEAMLRAAEEAASGATSTTPRPDVNVKPASSTAAWEAWMASLAQEPVQAPEPVDMPPPATPSMSTPVMNSPTPSPSAPPPPRPRMDDPPYEAPTPRMVTESVAVPPARPASAPVAPSAAPAAFMPQETEPQPAVARHESEQAGESTLPPRLRRKLQFEDDAAHEPASISRWVLIGAGVVVLVIASIVISRVMSQPKRVAPVETAAVTETTPPVTQAPVITPPAPAPVQTAPPPAPTPVVSKPVAATPTPANTETKPPVVAAIKKPPAPKPASTKTYGIVVATYLNNDRAQEERPKIAFNTNLTARVSEAQEDGNTVYRIIVGSYPDQKSAERAASRLVERGAADEARVVPISK